MLSTIKYGGGYELEYDSILRWNCGCNYSRDAPVMSFMFVYPTFRDPS